MKTLILTTENGTVSRLPVEKYSTKGGIIQMTVKGRMPAMNIDGTVTEVAEVKYMKED